MAECVDTEEECEGTSMDGVPRDVEIGEHKLRQVSWALVEKFTTQLFYAQSILDTKRVDNCGLTTRFDAISSMEIFKVINKPQQLHRDYTTRS